MSLSIPDFCREVLHEDNEDLIYEFYSASVVVKTARNEHIIKAGDLQRSAPFLVSGIVRGYYVDQDGREITDCFASEPGTSLLGALHLSQSISDINLITVTDCEILYIPVGTINYLINKYPHASAIYNRMLESALSKHTEIKRMLFIKRPALRFQWFCDTFPELYKLMLERKLHQKDIASYINMTEQTLSAVIKNYKPYQ